MVKEYLVKKISYNKEGECNEDVFVAKKENKCMFLNNPKFKFLDVMILGASQCVVDCKS